MGKLIKDIGYLEPAEEFAYSILKERGYKNIIKTKGGGLPDFICDNKEGWEIKEMNAITFRLDQILYLEKNPETNIMCIDIKRKMIQTEFKCNDRF
jgi:hypothetical protein